MSTPKGARSKLADVLADIKNSRSEDNHETSNRDTTPVTTKRRHAVNYVALSGHTPRPRSSHANTSSSSHTNNNVVENKNNSSTLSSNNALQSGTRSRTYVLKLFDRTVDLAPFLAENTQGKETPLYPICRDWVHNHQKQNQQSTKISTKSEKPQESEVLENEVHELPPPRSKSEIIKKLKLSLSEDMDFRIPPHPERKTPNSEVIDIAIGSLERDQCMKLNKERWRKVRADWREARAIHESRYEESFRVLEELCTPHQ